MVDHWFAYAGNTAIANATYYRATFTSPNASSIYATTETPMPAGNKYYLEFPSACVNNDISNLVWGLTSANRSDFRTSAVSGAGNVYWRALPQSFTIDGRAVTPLPKIFGVWTLGAAIDLVNMRLWLKGIAGVMSGTTYAWNSAGSAPGTADPATNVGGYDISALSPPLVCYVWSATSGTTFWRYQSMPLFYGAVPIGFNGWNGQSFTTNNTMVQTLS